MNVGQSLSRIGEERLKLMILSRPVIRSIVLAVALILGFSTIRETVAQTQEPLDGPKRIFKDDLLENLAGKWQLTRTIRGTRVQNTVDAAWVLNHQFIRIHMKDTAVPSQYEAMVFVGYDNASERYVVHWIDIFGGRFSETLGYGWRQADSIEFVFEYPDGPFHNTFTWNREAKTWTFLMETRNSSGKWVQFAKDELKRGS